MHFAHYHPPRRTRSYLYIIPIYYPLWKRYFLSRVGRQYLIASSLFVSYNKRRHFAERRSHLRFYACSKAKRFTGKFNRQPVDGGCCRDCSAACDLWGHRGRVYPTAFSKYRSACDNSPVRSVVLPETRSKYGMICNLREKLKERKIFHVNYNHT